MSVLQNPVETIIKNVFPQDENDDKHFEIIQLIGTPYCLHDSSNQPLLIGHDKIQKLKTNDPAKQCIRRVQVILSTDNVCEFHVLFANENLYSYRLLL